MQEGRTRKGSGRPWKGALSGLNAGAVAALMAPQEMLVCQGRAHLREQHSSDTLPVIGMAVDRGL